MAGVESVIASPPLPPLPPSIKGPEAVTAIAAIAGSRASGSDVERGPTVAPVAAGGAVGAGPSDTCCGGGDTSRGNARCRRVPDKRTAAVPAVTAGAGGATAGASRAGCGGVTALVRPVAAGVSCGGLRIYAVAKGRAAMRRAEAKALEAEAAVAEAEAVVAAEQLRLLSGGS